MHPNVARAQSEASYNFIKRCSIATFSLCGIYATGVMQECIKAERTYNLFLYPSLLLIAVFFGMWSYSARYKVPQDPQWYRHHNLYMLIASFCILLGLCMLIVAIYPIYGMWSCAIAFLCVVLISNVSGAVTYITDRLNKHKVS